jgi:hypothetical protein
MDLFSKSAGVVRGLLGRAHWGDSLSAGVKTCGWLWVAAVGLAGTPLLAQAYKEDIGYNALVAQVGSGLEDGTGIAVAQPEANAGTGGNIFYMPNANDAQFGGKTFIDGTGTGNGTSSHATVTVGHYLYGNTLSIAPGISEITGYLAGDWIATRLTPVTGNPLVENFRVSNHSYVARTADISAEDAENLMKRMDFYINQNGTTVVVGADNLETRPLPRLFAQSYNVMAVGRSDGNHSFGLTSLYGTGRVKPDLVAPASSTSRATAIVSAAAALLHEKADNMGADALDARRPEVIKSILMSGATKEPFAQWNRTETRPLDLRYGAGQLNIYNSYFIMEGGQFDGHVGPPSDQIGLLGWDYQEALAGNDSSLYYDFAVGAGGVADLSVMLNWNIQIQDQNADPDLFDPLERLADFSLRLWDSTGGFLDSQIDFSDSSIDNVEHLWSTSLDEGLYTLQVTNHSNFSNSFALSWRMTAIPEPGSGGVLLMVTLMVWAGQRRSRRR